MERLGELLQEPTLGQILPGSSGSSSKPPEEIQKCPDCGKPLQPVFIPVFNKWVLPACVCQVADFVRKEEERAKRERRAKVERLFANSGLGGRFRRCTFDSWVERPGAGDAYLVAKKYARDIGKNIAEGRGFLIFGSPGNGKSHLAAAVVNEALKIGFTAVFERVPKLLAKIRATYQGGEFTEHQIMKTLTDADLLVLDDTGAEKWTEWTEPTLYTIIDDRYSNCKPLIITTNSTLEELEKKAGARAMDRVLEMCEIVENRATSVRKERARAVKSGEGQRQGMG